MIRFRESEYERLKRRERLRSAVITAVGVVLLAALIVALIVFSTWVQVGSAS